MSKKTLITGFITILIGLVILLNVASTLAPEVQTAGDEIEDETLCNDTSLCLYNVTADATNPCRSSTNQSNACPSGQPSIPLGNTTSTIGLLLVMAGLVIGTIKGVRGRK